MHLCLHTTTICYAIKLKLTFAAAASAKATCAMPLDCRGEPPSLPRMNMQCACQTTIKMEASYAPRAAARALLCCLSSSARFCNHAALLYEVFQAFLFFAILRCLVQSRWLPDDTG
eukprot:1162021-Pelagomonas_calceolata.AAC.2